jgi:long-subunit fatty acid transport protein
MSRAICVLLACTAIARAEPRQDPTAGRAVFTGAATPHATSIDLNPAALELGIVDEVYIASTWIADQYGITTRTENLDTGTIGPGSDVSDTEIAPGGMVAAMFHAKDRATLAFALRTTPIELFPRNQPALAYHTLGVRERTWDLTLAASVRVTDELFFGLSLAAETRWLHLRYARDVALEQGINDPSKTEIWDVRVHSDLFSTDALTANIGLVWQLPVPSKNWYLGAAYHPPPGLSIQNELDGIPGAAVLPLGQYRPRQGVYITEPDGTLVKGDATVNVQEPASVDAELRGRLQNLYELHVGFRWEDLSRFSAYDVRAYGSAITAIGAPEWTERPRGFHDPYALWAGLEEVDTGATWRFGGRLGVETSSVPDARTSPMAIGPRSYTADIGVQLRVPESRFVVQLAYGVQYFPTVHVATSSFDPRDRIDCIDNGNDYSTDVCESVRRGYAIATAAGDYSRIEHALRIGLRYELY